MKKTLCVLLTMVFLLGLFPGTVALAEQTEELPSQTEQVPAPSEETPVQPEEVPVQPEEVPAQPEEAPVQPEEKESLPESQAVAKVGDTGYETLEAAVAAAQDGQTVTLLQDVTVTELVLNKYVTVDGGGKTISGTVRLEDGTLENVTLTRPAADGELLTIGSTGKGNIQMRNVTVKYPVDGEKNTITHIYNGNRSVIDITGCRFVNDGNDADHWSYGIYFNTNQGGVNFTGNTFAGAFRTMLANINGVVSISGNTFSNTVEAVNGHGGSGSGAEPTCITTASDTLDGSITNNVFDNAGAFYFQLPAEVSGNTICYDRFVHYIQTRKPLDMKENEFVLGENPLLIYDTPDHAVELPVGQMAVCGWAVPGDDWEHAADYAYAYNEEGKRVFQPRSDRALEVFKNTVGDNIGEGETIVVTGGTFEKDPSEDVAEGSCIVKTSDGKYVVGEHSWQVTYAWSEDNKTCTATRTCGNGCGETETVNGTVTARVTKAPTCTAEGETTYTAVFEAQWAEAQEKSLTDIAPRGHSWKAVTYVWEKQTDGSYTCIASRDCEICGETETAEAVVTARRTKEPTVKAEGEMTYTAEFAADWAEAQTKTEAIAKLTPEKPNTPQTGDNSHLMLWTAAAMAALCVGAAISLSDRKRKRITK